MTDGYGKPENLTPVLLWSSTANRFQTRDEGRIQPQPHFLQNKCWSLSGRKICLYLAVTLFKSESSQDTLV